MRIGSVVSIVGETDERVRTNPEDFVAGTITDMTDTEIEVLTSSGFLWRGNKRDVIPVENE